MASISTDAKGNRRIQLAGTDGKRLTLRLGKVQLKTAKSLKTRVECLLEARIFPFDPELANWVKNLEPPMAAKLAAVGLIDPPQIEARPTLGPFLDSFVVARRGDYKPASLVAWGQVVAALKACFGPDCPVSDVTAARAEAFRQARAVPPAS